MSFAITTYGKLSDLQDHNLADKSVSDEFHKSEVEHSDTKGIYSKKKNEMKDAFKKLNDARDKHSDINFLEHPIRKINSYIQLKKIENYAYKKEEECNKAKLVYKNALSKFREVKKAIRQQHKIYKQYEKLQKIIAEAQRCGIEVPDYLVEEAHKRQQPFSLEKGYEHFLKPCNSVYYKELKALVNQSKMQNVKDVETTILNKLFSKRKKNEREKDEFEKDERKMMERE